MHNDTTINSTKMKTFKKNPEILILKRRCMFKAGQGSNTKGIHLATNALKITSLEGELHTVTQGKVSKNQNQYKDTI